MSVFKKVSAFLTAVGVTAAMAGCGYNTTQALEVDGYSVPAGVYIYFANTAYNQALSQLKEENPDLDTEDTKAVKAALLEGKDVLTWIQDKATEMCVDFVATEKKFDELGLELDAQEKLYLDSMMEYYWTSSQETMEKNGISENSFRMIMTSSYKSDAVFEYYYGVGGDLGITEEELFDYYAEHNMRTQYVSFNLTDGEGNMLKSDGKAEMKKMVEGFQERVQEAYDNGGVEAVMTEMNYVQEDYNYYVTSISEEAAGVEDPTTTTPRNTAETTAPAESDENAGETTAAETEGETTGTAEEATEAENAEEETTAAEETTEAATEEDTAETEAAETTAANEETETETTEKTEDDYNSEETETETIPFENEKIISVIHKDDYDDESAINYNPSEKTYNTLLGIEAADYGKPYFVEEDEQYYLAVRYDIKDRMTEDDLWTESTMNSVNYTIHKEDFEELLDTWTEVMEVKRNDAAYKRYDPFKFEF